MAKEEKEVIREPKKSQEETKQESEMAKGWKKRAGLIAFTLVILGAIGFTLVNYAEKVSLLYLTVDEVLDRLERYDKNKNLVEFNLVGKMLRIRGNLRPHTTRRYKGRMDYKFDIMSKATNRYIPVRYSGILPDNFQDHAELVLEGKLEKRRLFRAYSILAKCSSKYQSHKIIYGKKKGKKGKKAEPSAKKNKKSMEKLTLKEGQTKPIR